MTTVGSGQLIYVVRHCETASNAARIVQTPEIPLSPRGLAQAERLAQRLADHGVAAILSSDLLRARMTADLLRSRTGASLELDPLLQERNFGDVRGTRYADLDFDLFAPDYEPPGGESWDTFHGRADRAWRRVVEAAARVRGNLAVVTHGLVCRAFAERHLALAGHDPLATAHWGNTSLTIVEARAPFPVRVLNCLAHLDDGTGATPLDPAAA